jgi:hypothetical protein
MIDTLSDFVAAWKDEANSHLAMNDAFVKATEADEDLNAHRKWCTSNFWGFGENSFSFFWKIIVDAMPKDFSFLEVGVHRGQITSLIGMLAKRTNRFCQVVGLSTYDGRELGLEGKTDFLADTWRSWNKWVENDVAAPIPTTATGRFERAFHTITADSTTKEAARAAKELAPYDVCYIDGSHEEKAVRWDIENYGAMVRPGGYLVMDDACCNLKMPGHTLFPGIQSVSKAVDSMLPPFTANEDWTHLGSLVHLRLFRRNK